MGLFKYLSKVFCPFFTGDFFTGDREIFFVFLLTGAWVEALRLRVDFAARDGAELELGPGSESDSSIGTFSFSFSSSRSIARNGALISKTYFIFGS